VDVSSGEDDAPKKSTSDDARDGGASSAESIAPNPIRSNVLVPTGPFVTEWAATTDPPIGVRRHKRPPPPHSEVKMNTSFIRSGDDPN
jgi:hypothetical protein